MHSLDHRGIDKGTCRDDARFRSPSRDPRGTPPRSTKSRAGSTVDPAKGLHAAEVKERAAKYGQNELAAKKKESGWQSFVRQYNDVMQMVLFGAAIVNQIFTQEISTTLVLVGLTVFNAVLGMNQEAKAEASLAALQQMMQQHRPRATRRQRDRGRRERVGTR